MTSVLPPISRRIVREQRKASGDRPSDGLVSDFQLLKVSGATTIFLTIMVKECVYGWVIDLSGIRGARECRARETLELGKGGMGGGWPSRHKGSTSGRQSNKKVIK